MSYLKAIRKRCIDCCGNIPEVAKCNVDTCPLHSWRAGKKPEVITSEAKTALKVIREFCLYCSWDDVHEVRKCKLPECDLYIYRMGHNPKRAKSEIQNGNAHEYTKNERKTAE